MSKPVDQMTVEELRAEVDELRAQVRNFQDDEWYLKAEVEDLRDQVNDQQRAFARLQDELEGRPIGYVIDQDERTMRVQIHRPDIGIGREVRLVPL